MFARSSSHLVVAWALSCAAVSLACSEPAATRDEFHDEGETTSAVEYEAVFTVSRGPFEIRSTDIGHVAFPDITRLSNGRVLIVYREAMQHAVDTTGRLVEQFGSSDGSRWSAPELLYDEPGVDDRDPSVARLSDGRIALTYFQYAYQATPAGPLANYQVFYGESTDDGQSFGDFTSISGAMNHPGAGVGAEGLWEDAEGRVITVHACSSPVFEVDGRIRAPLYGGPPWVPTTPTFPRSRVMLALSDDGTNWVQQLVAPEQAPELWLQEPAVLPLDAAYWLMHVRAASGDTPNTVGTMRQAISRDGGRSWSAYQELGFIGQAPYLARLSNGVLLSAFRWYDDALTTTNVNFMASLDEGQTWSAMISILEPQLQEVGYPSIVELDDGRVLIVYYVGGTSIEGIIYDVELVERA